MMHRQRALAPAWALLITLAALTTPSRLVAQGLGDTPTFLAIPDAYPDVDGPAVVIREPGRNIILLRASEATAETLSVALALLGRLTERTPLRPGLGHMAPVTGYHFRTPLEPTRQAELEAIVTRLKQSPVASIGNLGAGRSMPLVPGSR